MGGCSALWSERGNLEETEVVGCVVKCRRLKMGNHPEFYPHEEEGQGEGEEGEEEEEGLYCPCVTH